MHDDLTPYRYPNSYLVKTLNKKGPSSTYIDEYAKQFIHYAASQKDPVLELGAAYGFVAIEALKAGATLIANDLDPRHLNILYNNTPEGCRSRLTLLPGEFPQDINLANESIAGCYIAHMLGYLAPEDLPIGFMKLYRWLKPGALLFILSSSPYRAIYKDLLPIYEQRVREHQQWPGYFKEIKQLISGRLARYAAADTLHFLDDKVLSRELMHVGFIIKEAKLYPRKDLSKKVTLDGREGVVVIAQKPYR
jgi:polyketide synthase PksJ